MSAHVQLHVTVVAHPDKPGVESVTVGDEVLFKAGDEVVLEVTGMVKVPVNLVFGEPKLAVSYRVP